MPVTSEMNRFYSELVVHGHLLGRDRVEYITYGELSLL